MFFAGSNGGVARKVGNDWQTPKDGQWETDADLNKRATTGAQKTANADTRQQPQQQLEQKATPEQRQSAAAKSQQWQQSEHQQAPQQQDYNRAYNARQAGASRERNLHGGGGRPAGGGGRGGGGGRLGR